MSEYDLSRFGKVRIEALTDGIFAIAMTVLVLNLNPPNLPDNYTEEQVLEALQKMLPSFFAFMASFITLGMYWVAHHSLFRFLIQTDKAILWLNMYFLMFVSLVPFTSGLYSGDTNSRITNSLFGANLILLGLLSYGIWSYARTHGHVVEDMPDDAKHFITRRLLTAPLLAATAMVVSLFQPIYAEYVYFAMIPIFMITVRRLDWPFSKKSGNRFEPPASS